MLGEGRKEGKIAPHNTNVCKFSQLCGVISSLPWDIIITFKLGKFTNFKVLFPVVSLDFN